MVPRASERGSSVAVEAALVLPVAMLFVGLVIVMAGHALAQQAVTAAATRAARAASLERSQASAERAALDAAVTELGNSRITCTDAQVSVDARGLAAPMGTVASVTVRLTCRAVSQDSARAAAVLGGSAEDGREAGRRALFNSALGDATVKVDRAATFTTAVVEGTAIRVLPMVDVTVHQAARVPTERIR